MRWIIGLAVIALVVLLLLWNPITGAPTAPPFADAPTPEVERAQLTGHAPDPDPGPDPAPDPDPDPDSKSEKTARVYRDLADGATLSTEEVGEAVCVPARGEIVYLTLGGWTSPSVASRIDGTWWLYREVELEVFVRTQDGSPLDLKDVKMELSRLDTRLAQRFEHDGEPKDVRKSISKSLSVMQPASTDEPFRMQVPRVHGFLLKLHADGWQAEWAELPVPADPRGTARLSFVLRKSPVVRGRIVDRDGKPVGDANIYLFSNVLFPDRAALETYWYGCRTRGRTSGRDWTRSLVLRFEGKTDDAGRFSIPVRSGGDVSAYVFAKSYRRFTHHVGRIDDDRTESDWELERGKDEFITFAVAGNASLASDVQLEVSDRDDPLDAWFDVNDGRVNTLWLRAGATYKITGYAGDIGDQLNRVFKKNALHWWVSGRFTWEDQESVNLVPRAR